MLWNWAGRRAEFQLLGKNSFDTKPSIPLVIEIRGQHPPTANRGPCKQRNYKEVIKMLIRIMSRTAATVMSLLVAFAARVDVLANPPPLSIYGGISVSNIQAEGDAAEDVRVPISGFIPRVVVGLTDERSPDDADFFALDNSPPSGNSLPLGENPYYTVALLDTGAQTNVFRNAALRPGSFNLLDAQLEGANTIQLVGAAGSEFGVNSDVLGFYTAGLTAVTGEEPITVDANALDGQINVSVAVLEDPSSIIPDVLGMTYIGYRTTVIRNDQPQQVTFEGKTYQSPNVEFFPLGTIGLPDVTRHAPLIMAPGDRFLLPPIFVPGINILNFDLKNDPLLPSASGSLFLSVDVADGSDSLDNMVFFFDTGAEVSVISQLTAVNLGHDPVLDPPDFTIEIDGAGGTLADVPGIYLDFLNIDTVGGTFSLTDVPVIILDLPDPRDGVNIIPGLIGTNLFVDRNLEINPQPREAYLAISDPLLMGDFNLSGSHDPSDIDMIYAEVPGTVPPTDSKYDLVADGVVNQADVDELVMGLMSRRYGDTDLDQDVDLTDFQNFLTHFDPLGMISTTWLQGNFDGDDNTDLTDFSVLVTNFSPNGYPATSVPEPSSLMLVLAGLGAIGATIWFRRQA